MDEQVVALSGSSNVLHANYDTATVPAPGFLVPLPRAGYGDGVTAVTGITACNLEAAKGWGMHDVKAFNLKCGTCGKDIEELPFLPLTSSRPVFCRECNQKRPAGKKKGNTRRPRKRRR